jgi:hypothetical protein
MRRTAQHEVAAGGANRGAVEQQADMFGIGVLAANFQAVHDGLGAYRVAIQAVVNALP